jgi:dienelactone hydrolase
MCRRILPVILIVIHSATSSFAADRPARTIPEADTVRERFLKLIDRPHVAPNATEKPLGTQNGLTQTAFAFDSEAGQRVPGIMIAPKTPAGRLPVVIVLHGTGGSKQGMIPLLQQFAERGLIGMAIDGRFAGERSDGTPGAAAYQAAILETWKTGKGQPFFYDTAWDLMRLLDYLETRSDVDPAKIGAIGFSKGGIELYLTAAVDQRLAASVPCIGVQSFGWALDNNAWQSRVSTIQNAVDQAAREQGLTAVDAAFVRQFYERVVPGIHHEFDGPIMLPFIAPRPLLVINGDSDDRTPRAGLELCIKPAREAYKKLDASKNFEFLLQADTGHAVRPESERKAINWLVKHLTQTSGGR